MDFVFNICGGMNFTMSADTAAHDRQPSAVKSAELFTDGISAKAVDSQYIPSGILSKIADAEYFPFEAEEE